MSFSPPFFLQITTGTTKTDTAPPDTMTGETATVTIEKGTGTVMRGATETEDTTGIVIDGTTTGALEDTTEEGDIDENARKGLAEGAKTKCKLTALQRVTAPTVIGDGAINVAGMAWALQNGGALRQRTRSNCL